MAKIDPLAKGDERVDSEPSADAGLLNPEVKGKGPCLFIIRHGKTKFNKSSSNGIDKIRGWMDIPLTAEGKAEAKVAGEDLKDSGIVRVYCSDLSRAEDTAKIIASEIGLSDKEVEPTRAFRPWNLRRLPRQTFGRSP